MTPIVKTCCTCKQEKPIMDFGRLSKSADGYSSRCRPCWRIKQKESRERNPERTSEKKKKYYYANKDEILAKQKPKRAEYREKNREAILAKKKEYRLANKEKVQAAQRIWERSHPEKKKQYYMARKQRNPESLIVSWKRNYNKEVAIQRAKEWKKRNPDAVSANQADRRARKVSATPVWANRFFIKEAYSIAKLRTKSTGIVWHVDHIVPLKGKAVCGLHVENNLQVIPASVNYAKNNRWEDGSCHFWD